MTVLPSAARDAGLWKHSRPHSLPRCPGHTAIPTSERTLAPVRSHRARKQWEADLKLGVRRAQGASTGHVFGGEVGKEMLTELASRCCCNR